LALAVLGSGLSGRAARADDDVAAAASAIQALGDRAINILRHKGETTFAQREAAFRELLVEGFHIKTISRFVLGRYAREATESQLADYDSIFVDFITRVYAARFDAYNGETFELLQTVPDASGDIWVRSRINRTGGSAPIGVDYRVRKIEGAFKVIDVNVEGISMLNTHRVEFASAINRKGIDGFIADLKARLAQPITAGS
jgi:phospholipid transport system substrate-binding protein